MVPARRNQNWLPSLFNEFFGNDWIERARPTMPAVNILETEDAFRVEVAAPGMTRDDFRVDITPDNELVISVEKKTENREGNGENERNENQENRENRENEDRREEAPKGTYLRREFSYSQFQQRLLLPDNVEKENITAKVEHGVMTIEIPKMKEAEKEAEPRHIEVQ